MTTNVGTVDRVIRILAGLAILAAGFYYKNGWGLIGLLPLLTGIVRFCPAYLPFGLSTCKKNKV
jgi:hypothetical protein